MECTMCHGSKVQHLTITTFGEEGSKTMDVDCVGCNGTGEIDERVALELEYERNMWCDCTEDHGVTYWKHGQHAILHKHHYRCKKCHKVVQIG